MAKHCKHVSESGIHSKPSASVRRAVFVASPPSVSVPQGCVCGLSTICFRTERACQRSFPKSWRVYFGVPLCGLVPVCFRARGYARCIRFLTCIEREINSRNLLFRFLLNLFCTTAHMHTIYLKVQHRRKLSPIYFDGRRPGPEARPDLF